MLELNSDLSTQASFKRLALSRAYNAGFASDKMSEDLYIQYIELLFTHDPKQSTILQVSEFIVNKKCNILT